jgi:hypothetical protein
VAKTKDRITHFILVVVVLLKHPLLALVVCVEDSKYYSYGPNRYDTWYPTNIIWGCLPIAFLLALAREENFTTSLVGSTVYR